MKITRRILRGMLNEMFNPVSGLLFSLLTGCDGKGGHDDLTDHHFIWWGPGGGELECTCAYELYNVTMKGGQNEEVRAFIAYWKPSIFEEFMVNDSVFVKRNFGQDQNWDDVLDSLEDFEKGEEPLITESDILTSTELNGLQSDGASLFFIVRSDGKIDVNSYGIPGPVKGGAMIGTSIEDMVTLLEEQYDVTYSKA
jgi:hypothetical protein